MRIDARLLVRFGPLESRTEEEAVLTEAALAEAVLAKAVLAKAGLAGPAHVMGCLCCTPRSAAGAALAALFRARAVDTGPAMRTVLAVVGPDGEAAVRAAVLNDPVASARFRLA